ncbi:MAG: hypothetical protein WD431_16830 [Cyclobacteriaceae bacterium]
MDELLEKEYEELEQTLQKQLGLLKEDSQIYVKVGGIALLGGLIAVGLIKLFRSKKSKKPKKALTKKKKQKNKAKKKKYSFFGNIRNRLFWMAMDFGKARLMDMLIAKTGSKSGKKQ